MDTYHYREPRAYGRTHATPGGRIVDVAESLIGCHYINGAYGATPGRNDGTPCRSGGIKLIADPKCLNPVKQSNKTQDLAVLAAQMSVKRYCICGGNYKSFSGGRTASPSDWDLNNYLASLIAKHPTAWTDYLGHYTPRRVYGPAPGGDVGGKLVWGESCKDIQHFDCVGFISYCLWQATGKVIQLEIAQWRTPNQPMIGSKVYDLKTGRKPDKLMDADILIKADHHIAWLNASGIIIEAADTDLGVVATGRFNLTDRYSDWSHLVRLPL